MTDGRATLRRRASLLRWLGPTAPPTVVPPGIERREVTVRGRGGDVFPAWVYTFPGHAYGSVLVAPGLHFAGPRDPRFDRFCRILARSGLVVLAPFLPSYTALEVKPTAVRELEAAFDALLELPGRPSGPPGLFSISFGSMPALRLAGARGGELGSAVVFGGFASFRRTLRFALAGEPERERKNDPLNAPVVMLNLLPHVSPTVAPRDRELLVAAWLRYCAQTWGKEETKREEVYVPAAERVAAELPEPLRELFLVSCRARPGVEAVAEAALARSGDAFDWIDPLPHLGEVACPVILVHGREDDVIPFEESEALAEGLRARGATVTLHLTGMYGHTKKKSLGELAREAREGVREVGALLGILDALARL